RWSGNRLPARKVFPRVRHSGNRREPRRLQSCPRPRQGRAGCKSSRAGSVPAQGLKISFPRERKLAGEGDGGKKAKEIWCGEIRERFPRSSSSSSSIFLTAR